MLKKIKNMSKKSLLIFLGLIIGVAVSIYASGTWRGTYFLQDAKDNKRVLNLDDIQKIKDDLEYLKNNSGASLNHTDCHWEYPHDVTNRGWSHVYCPTGYHVAGAAHYNMAIEVDDEQVALYCCKF